MARIKLIQRQNCNFLLTEISASREESQVMNDLDQYIGIFQNKNRGQYIGLALVKLT